MKAIIGGSGLLFRFLIAAITAVLVVSTMSMAMDFVVSAAGGTGGEPGGVVTGRFIQEAPDVAHVYLVAEIFVGIVTFIGSFFVLSRK
jgi:hypothetical protein